MTQQTRWVPLSVWIATDWTYLRRVESPHVKLRAKSLEVWDISAVILIGIVTSSVPAKDDLFSGHALEA